MKEDITERLGELEKQFQKFQEDLDYIYDRFSRQDTKIDNIEEEIFDRKAEMAEYIRGLTDKKFQAYQELIEARRDDRTQKDIAEELGIDDAVLSRFKKEFKEKNIL
jgi:response regulator of citrate/malate metabolism